MAGQSLEKADSRRTGVETQCDASHILREASGDSLMGFKEEADFARFVSMGAVGTAAVARYLREQHGHHAIELERYAMANKVWHTKVKRLRLPDLVCARCGKRVESRAKSKLGIVLSHSDAPGREWDTGGMRADDWFAFLRADMSTFPPRAGLPTFFSTDALRAAVGRARRSAPKAASEGSEVTLTWPTWVPRRSGRFEGVDSKGRIVCRWEDGSQLRYWQWRNWDERRYLYVAPGGDIGAGETLVAGVVQIATDLDCPGETWELAAGIAGEDLADRYAAVKAARATDRPDLSEALVAIADDRATDWRIRLESLAGLALFDPAVWTGRISTIAAAPEATDEQRMEAVFVLSEIPTAEASAALALLAAPDPGRSSELRAAAAWGLGQGVAPRPDLLLPLTADDDDLVSLHAITAMDALPDQLLPTLVGWLGDADARQAAAAAQLLLRHERVGALLDACERGVPARLWALRALGDLDQGLVTEKAGDRLTPDLAAVLGPMWLGKADWLRNEGREGLEALDVQKVRFDPMSPDG